MKNKILIVFLFNLFALNSGSIFSQPSFFEGKIFHDDVDKTPLGGARVSLTNNEYSINESSLGTGNFQFELDENFGLPLYLLCYKSGYFSRIFYLPNRLSKEFGLRLAIINTINTIHVYGKIVDKESREDISLVSIFADYGELTAVSNDSGHFNIQINYPRRNTDVLFWFEQERYKPLVLSVPNPAQYNNKNNRFIVELEPLPNSYDFNFIVRRIDTNDPIKSVNIEINDEFVGLTNDEGKLTTNKSFASHIHQIKAKLHHNSYSDTVIYIPLIDREISQMVKLKPYSFRIKALVYYESSENTLVGIPGALFRLEGLEIGRTNSIGKSELTFNAVTGDELIVEIPPQRRFTPSKVRINLNTGQSDLNVQVQRGPVRIEIAVVDSLSNHNVTDIESLELVINQSIIQTQKFDAGFFVETNIFNPEDKARVRLNSQQYEVINENIDLNVVRTNIYQGTFYVKPIEKVDIEKISQEEEGEGVLIINSEPAGARIYIDDQQDDFTPDTLTLSSGMHSIRLEKVEYTSASAVVNIKPDSTSVKNIVLEGPIAPLQKIAKRVKISTGAGILGLIMKYPSGKIYPFPAVRIGGHFYPLLNPDCGFKLSYLASKVPYFYTSQEVELGFFWGTKRFHHFIGVKESNFESFKKIKARFAGSSTESFISFCLGSENIERERLLFLNQYSNAIVFGYERSIGSINKSVEGDFKTEQEFYFGYKLRWMRGILDFRFGFIDPKLSVLDIEEKEFIVDLKIARLFITYNYFLN